MERWRASFETDPEHADALVDALGKVIPSERLDLVTGTTEDDRPFATIALTVAATAPDEAYARARDEVSKAVEIADLPRGLVPIPSSMGLLPPLFGPTSLYEQLSQEASRLTMDGQHDTAVLRAQAACEVYAEEVLKDLVLRRGGEKLRGLTKPRTFSLSDDRTIALFFLLTGEWIDEAPWWGDYTRHLKRRNRIVHGGGVVDADEADESLDAAQAFRDYLREAWARVLGTKLHPDAS